MPALGNRTFACLERRLAALSRRRAPAIALLAAAGFLGSLLAALAAGLPYPIEHDEFSHLLAADTFASGRVTNPTHPFWAHFETFHVIQRPSYTTKFPPAQGAILAAGQVLFGTPAAGLWLSAALLTGAVAWMLYGWLAPAWALAGGALTLLHFAIYSYWTQTFWSGAVPAAGGALVFGAVRRIVDSARARDVLWFAAGLFLLAHSRPFEGMVASLPPSALLLGWMLRGRRRLVRLGIPLAAGAAAVLGSLAWYNQRVTGDPLRMPYQVYLSEYEAVSTLTGPAAEQPRYRNPEMARYYGKRWNETAKPAPHSGLARFIESNRSKITNLWTFYLGPLLTLPLFFLGGALRERWMRFAFWALVVVMAVLFQLVWVLAHYAAPVMALVVLLVTAGLRELRARGACGRFVSRGIPAAVALALLVRVAYPALPRAHAWAQRREAIRKQLEAGGGRHLILVRYSPEHIPNQEWVYNRADIDRAAVVWARELSAESNAALIRYFRDRQVWLIQPDTPGPRPHPYPSLPPHGSESGGGAPSSARD